MRIVTFFILLTLAAAVYLANFASKSDEAKSPSKTAIAGASAAAQGTPAGATGGPAGSNDSGGALPSEFPAELTRRSGGSSTGMGPLVDNGPRDRASRPEKIQFDGVDATSESQGVELDSDGSDTNLDGGLGQLDVRPPGGRRRPTREVKLRDPSMAGAEESGEGPETFVGDLGPGAALDERVLEDVTNGLADEVTGDPGQVALNGTSADDAAAPSNGDIQTPQIAEPIGDEVQEPGGEGERSGTTTTTSSEPMDDKPLASAPAISQGLRGSVKDSGGRPLGGLRLGVVQQRTGTTVQTITSAADGTFAASGLEAGRYLLEIEPESVPLGVSAPVGQKIRRSGPEPAGYGSVSAEVAASGVTMAEVVLPLSSGVQGTILGLDGKVAKDVLVRAVSLVEGFEDTRTIAKTDGQGFFFLALVPGPYELQMLAPGEGAAEDRVRRMKIQAKPGSALLLEAVDLREESRDHQSFREDDQAQLDLSTEETAAEALAALVPTTEPVSMSVSPQSAVAPAVSSEEGPATRPGVQDSAAIEARASSQRKGPTAASVAAALAARRAQDVPKEPLDVARVPKGVAPKAQEVAQVGEAEVTLPAEVILPLESPSLDEPGIDAERAPSLTPEPDEVTLASQSPSELPTLLDPTSPNRVHLRGRVISRWGETLSALPVQVESADGRLLDVTQTSDAGLYVFENVPVGATLVRVAPKLKIGRSDGRGTTLLERPRPLAVVTSAGQKVVALEDVVVNLRRVYRLAGRIQIQDEALETFKKALRPVALGRDSMTDDQYRSAYLRGLRLVQQNKGDADRSDSPSAAAGREIKIASDGTFLWHCTLPAEDILLVLEPRTTRMSAGYGSAVGVPVTPAGVKPASLTIDYPSTQATTPGTERVARR